MCLVHAVVLFLFSLAKVRCEIESEKTMSIIQNTEYAGEKFPVKYLEAENNIPTKKDLDTYINGLMSTVSYFAARPNDTDVNKALGLFYMRSILKRALKDDGSKFDKTHYALLNDMIQKSDWVLSHYVYDFKPSVRRNNERLAEGKIAQIFSENDGNIFSNSLGKFRKNTLRPWILSKGSLNEYLADIDEATFPKEKYVELVIESISAYHTKIAASDICLSHIVNNRQPSINDMELRPCMKDAFCHRNLHSSPSIAYSLSHRLLNLMMYRTLRRCYWVSPRDDMLHIDILCAFMYRETVYLARRGYFFRDLFMEHVGLCAMMGYEEFFRRHWFHKAISWIDDEGCVQEFPNFIVNESRLFNSNTDNLKSIRQNRRSVRKLLANNCHNHQMALLVVYISHAIRHAIHFLQ